MPIVEGPLKQVIHLHMDSPNEPIPDGFAVCDGSTLNASQQDINPGGNYTLPNLLNKFILGADPTKSVGVPGVPTTDPNISQPAGAPGPQGSSGQNSHAITVAELPSHTHAGTPGGSTSVNFVDPGHTHIVTDSGHVHTLSDPGHSHIASSDSIAAHIHTVNDPTHSHGTTAIALQGAYDYPNGNVSTPVPGYPAYSGSAPSINPASTGVNLNAAGAHSHVISVASAQTGMTVGSHTTGITIASASTNVTGQISGLTLNIANTGSGLSSDNRPSYYGLVPIMRVKA